ncbi:MAG: hypothetical protein KBT03_13470 [Bacteroidales bacterium]|nr:hypothetical protein [Candidatus Scybalousia scybalohippi]
MGTTFMEIYTDWMLPVINDYKLDNLYIANRDVLFKFLQGFLKNGLTDFDCLKPLTYQEIDIFDEETGFTEKQFVFDYELDDDEKKIIAEIAVSKYFKRLIQDVKARMPYMSQREFKKEATAPVMKENDSWYNNLVSEYMEDIANYNMKHIEELPYWKDLV